MTGRSLHIISFGDKPGTVLQTHGSCVFAPSPKDLAASRILFVSNCGTFTINLKSPSRRTVLYLSIDRSPISVFTRPLHQPLTLKVV
jgi:hypothetical protein